ncbi:uncharacterized protein B0J16DRAFT_341326 [Fusarium flagelliforme]|uniref:uncharacterized protein n=1 Tax=Fusarium flagelliforme TaxID=2675880 RepID=UPI001E8CA815|nr:uncharacterized protein B0J16DRAFT_341326 [Fusarium flagelliforme]KAH7185315.1 hypothetical protein B0J16DRAFT_341326 [Fusarium flagelliforme]
MDLEWEESVQEWEWHALNYVNPIPPLIPFPSYCVSRRCGWCRFVIKSDEIVTARSSGGTESSAFAFGGSFDDSKLFATFKRCESNHDACATTGYHVECSAIASSLGLQKNDFLEVARYSYEPSAKEDKRREEWILNHLNQLMSDEFPKVPTEILLLINKHLILHYAIASLSCLRRPGRCTIEPLKDVWAKHFSLNGNEYIASLSNAPEPGSRLLWKDSESREDNCLYFSEDHLGIRQIFNDPVVALAEERQSGWWRTLPITSPILSFSHDGLKLRSIAALPLHPTICWSYPMTPKSLKNIAYHAVTRPSPSLGMTIEARMAALDFNEPNIVAYSTCWHGDRLIDIHIHKTGESLDFYRELEGDAMARCPTVKMGNASSASSLYWVYQPLNPGENVEQIWLRTENETEQGNDSYERRQDPVLSPRGVAVGLLTSHSRNLVMGRTETRHSEWKCIAETSTGSLMRVFFNRSVDGVSVFAAPTVDGCGNGPLLTKASSWTGAGRNPSNAEASLDEVRQVVACREIGVMGKAEITGLLFHYADGKQASVGRFRLDRADKPLSVEDSSCFYIGHRLSNEGKLTMDVIGLSTSDLGYREDMTWNEVPLEGVFMW